MHIFGSPRNKSKAQNAARFSCQSQDTLSSPASPTERKRFTSLLPQSVKTLFSKKSSLSSELHAQKRVSMISQQPQPQPHPHLYASVKSFKGPFRRNRYSVPPRAVSAAVLEVPAVVAAEYMQDAGNTFPRQFDATAYYSESSIYKDDCTAEFTERYPRARAKALAETVRRLQQTRSPTPLTPSSVDTGRTLSCFPEEVEYEEKDSDSNNSPRFCQEQQQKQQQQQQQQNTHTARFRTSCIEPRAGAATPGTISCVPLQSFAAGCSRPASMVVDTSCSIRSSSQSSSSTLSPTATSASSSSSSSSSLTCPQSILNASNESLTRTLSDASQPEPAQSNYNASKHETVSSCLVQQRTRGHPKQDNANTMSADRQAAALAQEAMQQQQQQQQQQQHHHHHHHHQRYSVAMSQNLNRRFQPRATHEYEQRIYCLQSHYSDVVERMETRTRKDAEHISQLEEQLVELRKANTELCAREAELAKKVQHYKSAKRATTTTAIAASQPVAANPEQPKPTTARGPGVVAASQITASKKLIEFIEHYQEDVRRLKQETNTAQEWVITLAELVVGPKRKHQSWDEWLGSCLDTLQNRRERMSEKAWLRNSQIELKQQRPQH